MKDANLVITVHFNVVAVGHSECDLFQFINTLYIKAHRSQFRISPSIDRASRRYAKMHSSIIFLLWCSTWLSLAFGQSSHPNQHTHHFHNHQSSRPPSDFNSRSNTPIGPNGFEEFYRWRQITYAPLDPSEFRPLQLYRIVI